LAGLVALALISQGVQAWGPLFIMLAVAYSGALYVPRIEIGALSLAMAAAIYTARTPETQGIGGWLWIAIVLAVAFGLGLASRARHSRARAAEERAIDLEREHEDVAAVAAEDERRRIARELHDIVSHSLATMVLQAGAAEQVLDRDQDAARSAMASIRTTGQEAVREMETLLGLIRDGDAGSIQPQPSLDDLEALVANARSAGLSVDVVIEGARRQLPAAVELSAYRVVQEGLTNALKHAQRANVTVVLRYLTKRLGIEVLDDGIPSGRGSGGRRGLVGVRERVSVFDGSFEAGPRPDGGWRLSAELPLNE
jgi:signal transduction histidine kinase